MARSFLLEQRDALGLKETEVHNLHLHAVRQSLSGTVVRLRQRQYGFPVNKAEITIAINHNNEVTYIMNGFRYGVQLASDVPLVSEEGAQNIAYEYLDVKDDVTFSKNELFIHHENRQSRLAYSVKVMFESLSGEWEVLVDAITGEIFRALDISHNCGRSHGHGEGCGHDHGDDECGPARYQSIMATGTGNVFDPDPLSSAQVAYGTGGYVDNNDANSADLTSQTFNVTLNDITFDGADYWLIGPYAEIVSFDPPATGLFQQPSPNFNFQREDQGFEPTNVYYHIDASMRYINLTLGCDIMPYQYPGGVQYDAHGANGADNSYYSTASGRLAFGEGCVDDAEDSDVIHHELGHGIHDWVTAGGLSQTDGLSEGCGDYWAQSYNRSFNYWTPADPAYNYMFNWDGHNPCWGGRTTGYGAIYPGGLVGQIHTDGQIWSTCLMKIYDLIGRAQTDKIFLEGLGMTNSGSSQNDAAVAAYQSAINMGYSMADVTTIHTEFTACGYTLPALPTPPVADFEADKTILCLEGDNVATFTSTTTGTTPITLSWSFPGGTPSASTDPNPVVTYSAAGTYAVTLTATNAYGTDIETKVDFIVVATGDGCINCNTFISTDVPKAIQNNATSSSVINVTDLGVVTDVNVVDMIGTHPRLGQLTFTLRSPQGTNVQLISGVCGMDDDFNINFDDDAAPGAPPCPYNDGGTYQSNGLLSAFNGQLANGTWVLEVIDNANPDAGNLTNWALEICTQCNVPTSIPTAVGTYTATDECTDVYGWTHYIDNAGTPTDISDDLLLLSIQKDGTVDISPNQVTVGVTAVGGAVDLSTAGYVATGESWFAMNRYWDVVPTSQPGVGGVNVRFYYTGVDYSGVETDVNTAEGTTVIASHNDLYFYKFTTGSGVNPNPVLGHVGGDPSNFVLLSSSSSAFNKDFQAEFNVLSFSGGGGGGGSAPPPLPVELLYFDGTKQGDGVLLEWVTETEINNDYFVLERSKDGREFSPITEIAGAGDSQTRTYYNHLDENPYQGANYYRLRQVDFDGSVAYSEVVLVYFGDNSELFVNPNPSTGEILLSYQSPRSEIVTYRVHDVKGRLLKMAELESQEGMNDFPLSLDLPIGVYVISVQTSTQVLASRMVILD
jgi:PKD repeat protein